MWSKVNHLTAFEESAIPVPNCLIRFDNYPISSGNLALNI